MAYYRPKFVSERETAERWVDGVRWDDGRWEDCAPCSVLMMVDATTAGQKPVAKTLDEAEKLRMAAGYGPTGGTNIQRLAATAVIRYTISLPLYRSGFDAIWSALKPGVGGAIAGSMGAFHSSHRLRRWDTNFAGNHAVYVQRESTTNRVWWMDPLATGTYKGEWVTKDELRQFFSKGIAAATLKNLRTV